MNIHQLVHLCSRLKRLLREFEFSIDDCMKNAENQGVIITERAYAKRSSKYTSEQIAKVKELRKDGDSAKTISKKVHIPQNTIYYLIRKY